jgi:hypothetical protein
VFLTKLTIDAEFPWCELISAFAVFDLDLLSTPRRVLVDEIEVGPEGPNHRIATQLSQLAMAFSVEVGQLRVEFCAHQPIALRMFQSKKCTIFEAWRQAFCSTQRAALKDKSLSPSAGALRCALMRYGGWGGSTSGVERSFSKQDVLAALSRGKCGEPLIDDEFVLVNANRAELDEATRLARRLFSRVYGTVRTGIRMTRRDVGIAKGPAKGNTESAFIRNRREAITTACKGTPRTDIVMSGIEPEVWTASHENEALFQMAKYQKRLVASLLNGSMPFDAVDPELAELLAAGLAASEDTDKKYFMDQSRKRKATAPPEKVSLEGKAVFVSTTLGSDSGVFRVSMRRGCMREVHDRLLADVIVVDDVSKPGQRNELVAHLKGMLLCTPAFIIDGSGPSMLLTHTVAKKNQSGPPTPSSRITQLCMNCSENALAGRSASGHGCQTKRR